MARRQIVIAKVTPLPSGWFEAVPVKIVTWARNYRGEGTTGERALANLAKNLRDRYPDHSWRIEPDMLPTGGGNERAGV